MVQLINTKYFLVMMAMMLPLQTIQAANISVSTDRNIVVMNESFQIIFESDGNVDDNPDFSPLDRDFQVLSTGTSSNINITNGRISTTKKWTLTVMAKTNGQLVIPPVSFGSDISIAATVNVTQVPPDSGTTQNSNREIFIEVEATPETPYVQAQVIYKVRLFRSVSTTNASLIDPDITGSQAVIERIDEDTAYEVTRGGKRYNVVERTYAIYPQVSGQIRIEPVIFQAQMATGQRTFFGSPFGNNGRTVVIQSDAINLEVKPIPDIYTGTHWLPAKDLYMQEEWSQDLNAFRVGEPITRTVSIVADGLMASQLPEIPTWESNDFKSYPDQPTLTDDKLVSGITGHRVEKIALIANSSGRFVIPAIEIPWWDVRNERLEVLTVPEQAITVLPALIDGQSPITVGPPPVGDLDPGLSPGNTIEPPQSDDPMAAETTLQAQDSRLWQWISAGLSVLWLGTLVMWLRARSGTHQSPDIDERAASLKQTQQQIKTACDNKDPTAVKNLLIQWGQQMWPDQNIISTSDINRHTGESFRNAMETLNESLYSRSQTSWDGKRFYDVFRKEAVNLDKEDTDTRGKLEPLFKIE